MSARPYTITIDTDNPFIFDLLDEAGGNYEATMQQHHPITNAVVDTWHKRGSTRGGATSDPDDVQMVEVPKPQEDPENEPWSPNGRAPDWQHENPDE